MMSGNKRQYFKLSDEKIKQIFLEEGTNVAASKKHKVAISTASDIRRVAKRYRAKLESMGLIEKAKEPTTEKATRRPCNKCGRMFKRTAKNWAICPNCFTSNRKMSDEHIYTPRFG